jgi:hypothetical protein
MKGADKQLTLRMHIAIGYFGRRRPSVRFSLFFSRIPTIITTQEVKRLQQHTYRLAFLLSTVKKKREQERRCWRESMTD